MADFEVPTASDAALADRLALLIPALRDAMQRAPDPQLPSLSASRLEDILIRLRDPLSEATRGGAFVEVWSVAGLRRNELRNAAVLAWCLDPQGSHGLGGRVLMALFGRLRPQLPRLDLERLGNASVVTEECPLGDDENRVDIGITGDDFVAFLEVKVDAGLGHLQLERYVEAAAAKRAALGKEHAFVMLLVPKGFRGSHREAITLTWRDMARVLDSASAQAPAASLTETLFRHFADHVRQF
ncbi:MAG: PD-(D/E)XK nuclease family protein [Alphaproteobacteria bacterium]|nr:PD-(D/E)XK nuclease family protein [Alphaproteobacteria bacterium]MBV9371084.1 PD-(D/E)XK nuclease family protein [Alphaproteobacteria bacterium]MBV9901542.1 PD-(D/E)XK nuclease family protein [Alphaproteobacteria bacterium]